MDRLFFIAALILLFCAGVWAQDWQWRTFSPPNGGWSINSPGAMTPDAEALENPDGKMGSYAYSDFYGHFAVVYRDSKANFWSLRPDYSSYYEKVRNDFIKASNGQLLKETRYESGKRIGRDVEIKIPAGQITGFEGKTLTKYRIERIRMFFVGKRFFLLLAVLPQDIVNTPPIDRFFDSFTTNTAPRAVEDLYAVDEDTPLTINAGRGVLANDSDAEDDKLSAALIKTQTAHGLLSFNADGSFIYTPDANYNGTDSFTYKANDGELDSTVVTVTIKVNAVNDAPTIANIPASSTMDELTAMNFTATAADIDNPPGARRFSLSGAPAGATIDPVSGAFRFTPTEAQGPSNFAFKVNVSDGAATTSQTVNLSVAEVNVSPAFGSVPPTASINELSAYNFAATAADADIPANTLTYSLVGAPAGATINPTTGALSWTPTEAQGNGSTYSFTVRVSDGTASAELPIRLTALEVNSTPVLSAISAQIIDELKPLSIKANAADTDDPTNILTYSLESGAPAGMTIDARTGAISWTPTEAQGAGDYNVTVRVADNGSPSLADSRSFVVRVNEINVAPRLPVIENKTVDEETPLILTAAASDSDLPANTLTYSLINAPAGASINPQTGEFSWTPTEAQGAGEYTISLQVTDNGSSSLSDTRSFTVRVKEINLAPRLSAIENKTIDEEKPLVFKVSATDADEPLNTLTYSLLNAPAGAGIDSSSGEFRWLPSEAQGAGTYNITVRVTDNGSPNLSDEKTFTVTVNEVNVAPVAAAAQVALNEDTGVAIRLGASDTDLPVNTLTYTIVNAPAHGTLSGTGANLTYTPNSDYNGADSFTFKVNDGEADSNTATVAVRIAPVNDAPVTNSDGTATRENTPVVINVTANDRDVDGDTLTIASVSDAVGGTVEIVGGNSVRFTPNKDFRGDGSFRYTISDGKGGTAVGTVTVTVNPPENGGND